MRAAKRIRSDSPFYHFAQTVDRVVYFDGNKVHVINDALDKFVNKSPEFHNRLKLEISRYMKIASQDLMESLRVNVSVKMGTAGKLIAFIDVYVKDPSQINALLGQKDVTKLNHSAPVNLEERLYRYIKSKREIFGELIKDRLNKSNRMFMAIAQRRRMMDIESRARYRRGNAKTIEYQALTEEGVIKQYARQVAYRMHRRRAKGRGYTYGSSRSLLGVYKPYTVEGKSKVYTFEPSYSKNIVPLLTLDDNLSPETIGKINRIAKEFLNDVVQNILRHMDTSPKGKPELAIEAIYKKRDLSKNRYLEFIFIYEQIQERYKNLLNSTKKKISGKPTFVGTPIEQGIYNRFMSEISTSNHIRQSAIKRFKTTMFQALELKKRAARRKMQKRTI